METVKPLPRSTPEAQGIASGAILAFVQAAEAHPLELHSLMLQRHGNVVAEGWWAPYAADRPHMLFSLSKSFTSSGVGLAVTEGRLSVDDPVLSFFPEEAPAEVSENLAAMRVRHLLSMSTGHDVDTTEYLHRPGVRNWARAFLARPVEHAPGTHFVYNSGASYMLSAIVQKVTGMTLLEYLQPRLFEPLGIEGATWETCPRGINTGGWGLSIKTKDIARFGQMYLQKGEWQGRQLLPEAWVEEATQRHISNGTSPDSDWEQGYGYQFWRCRHNAYRGDGAFGQYCLVIPEQDAVLAITSGVADMQAVLNLVWEHLLPAMGPTPLAADAGAQGALVEKLAGLAIEPVQGQASSPMAEKVSGRRYAFTGDEAWLQAAEFGFGDEGCTVTLSAPWGEQRVTCGSGAWVKGTAALGGPDPHRPRQAPEPQPVAISGAWTDENIYTFRLCLYETPFSVTFTCRFDGDDVTVDAKQSLGFGPTEAPRLVGKAS